METTEGQNYMQIVPSPGNAGGFMNWKDNLNGCGWGYHYPLNWNNYDFNKSLRECQSPRVENKRIACEPFPYKSIKKNVKGNFATAEQKTSLTGLKIIYGNLNYSVGAIVYLDAENYIQPWAKKIYVHNGVEFILVPEDFIVMIDQYPIKTYTTTKVTDATNVTPNSSTETKIDV